MKGLLILALCAVVPIAGEIYMSGSVVNQDEVFIMDEKFMIWGQLNLKYKIKFPRSSGMVHLMVLDAFEGPKPTECGEDAKFWTLSLYEGHPNCALGEMHATYGQMLECSGSTQIEDSSYVDKFFMLVRCEAQGLWGTHYELWDYDTPHVASATASFPSIALLCLASLLASLRLL